MPSKRDHAVVIGASMAGLLAARVLSAHFARVTVIERDHLPEGADHRAGVPQGRHVHGLLARGLLILEELFPGFGADLNALGVPYVEWMRETIQLIPTGWTPRFDSGLISRPITRVALESVVRRRVKALGNVTFIEGAQASELITQSGRVIGLRLEPRRRGDLLDKDAITADLVVDASGRGSKAPEWLKQLGIEAPRETTVNSHLGYATRMYRLTDNVVFDWKAMLMLPRPERPKGGVLTIVEGDQWMLTLAGVGDAKPPTDEDGLSAYIASLPLPQMHEFMRHAQPISPIYGYQRTANLLRQYEHVPMPEGFIVTGDAVCAFNPVYGQGMTAAAMGAQTLDRALSGTWSERRFQKMLARSNAAPWLMATSEDVRFSGVEISGTQISPLIPLATRWLDVIFQAAPINRRVSMALLEALHLLRMPMGLFAPDVWLGLLQARLSGTR